MDDSDSVHEAIAIQNGRISALGSSEEILRLKSETTKLVNLNNKTVLPGFIDAHQHLFPLGFNLTYVDCRLNSIEEVVEAIEKAAEQSKTESEWIIGWGFDESLYKEKRKLNKWDFSHVENPVYITRYCHHEAVINEVAIQKANITNETVVDNGIIEKNDQNEITGLLIEKAMLLVEKELPPYTEENMTKALQLAIQKNLENGITAVHDAGLGFLIDPYKEYKVIKKLDDQGMLHLQIYLMVLAEYFNEFLEEMEHQETNNVKFGPMKLFLDGTLSGKTAAVVNPYKNSDDRGMLLYTDEELKRYVKFAHDKGKQVAVHAIGDRAVEQILSIYETVNNENPREDVRHRIEHTTLSNEKILSRMKEMKIIPVPQPALIHTAGDAYVENLEEEFIDNIFSIRQFISNGLMPAGSSDSPVIDCSPFLGIYAAMTRETVNGQVVGEKEKITLKSALKMYTINAAHASFSEQEKGTIEVGKCADLVVLPEAFMNFTAEEIKQTEVEMTVVNGQVVYENKIQKSTIN